MRENFLPYLYLPVDNEGNLIFNPNPYNPPMQPDQAAIDQALSQGQRSTHRFIY